MVWRTAEELTDIDFDTFVTSTSSDMDVIANISVHFAINDEEEFDDKEQPTDYILKPTFKEVINIITFLEDYSLLSEFGADLI